MSTLKQQRIAILVLHCLVEALAALSSMSSFVFPGNKVSFHDYHADNEVAQKLFRRGLGPAMSGGLFLFSLVAIFFQQTDNLLIWTWLGLMHAILLVSFVFYPIFVLGETSVTNYDIYAPDVRGLCVFHVLILLYAGIRFGKLVVDATRPLSEKRSKHEVLASIDW